MKTIKRFFTSWEFFLVILLAVVCAVFYYVDAARVAAGISRRPVFYFANVVRSMRPYFLYSFMTLGMMLILAMGDIDISVGAIGTLSVVTLGVTYNNLAILGGMSGPVALTLSLLACLIVGAVCGALNGFLCTRFKEFSP